MNDFSLGGKGKALPEFVITFKDDVTTIIVVECKKTVSKHETEAHDHPKDYAVDGTLYYAKFLKEDYNVIAVAVSGTKRETLRASAFLWNKGQDEFTELRKARDIILEPRSYVSLARGKKIQREYSLDDIRETALDMHEFLREIKMTERHKPIFIAGILIALNDDDFAKTYINLPSFNSVITNITTAIDNVLRDSGIKYNRIQYIKQAFKNLLDNSKFAAIPLGNKKSIVWYIEELEIKIKPMMDHADSTIDALDVFYHEFIKYSGGDGSGLGIVLTPQHLTEFMCNLADVNKKSRVVDICCGSGSFLVTAMSMMFKDANPDEVEEIREDGLYGVEFDDELYTLAVANMIIRKDGKSNIYFGDCFDELITAELKGVSDDDFDEFYNKHIDVFRGKRKQEIRKKYKGKNANIGLINPPYSQDDGFVKRKKLGRIDAYGRWQEIEKRWLELYRYKDVEDGLSARHKVTDTDEWLCEAYMKTDYSQLGESDFQQTVNDYLAYLVRCGEVYES